MSIGCIICSEVFSSSDPAEKYPNAIKHCGHAFHADCLKQWLSKSSTCPVCRSPCVDIPFHMIRLHLQAVNYLDVSQFYNPPAKKSDTEALIAAKDAEIAELRKQFSEWQERVCKAMGNLKQVDELLHEAIPGLNHHQNDNQEMQSSFIDLSQTLPAVPTPPVLHKAKSREDLGRSQRQREMSGASAAPRPGTSGAAGASSVRVSARSTGVPSRSAASAVASRIRPSAATARPIGVATRSVSSRDGAHASTSSATAMGPRRQCK